MLILYNIIMCNTEVDHVGLHSLSCRRSQIQHPRHAAVNDLLKRSLASAKIPSLLEPMGIARSDGRRPDGISVMPWKNGWSLVSDAPCPDTSTPSHVALATMEAGLVASQAEKAKPRSTPFSVPATILFQLPSKHQGYLGWRP